MAIEIVDFPINSMVIFHGKMLVHQRVIKSVFQQHNPETMVDHAGPVPWNLPSSAPSDWKSSDAKPSRAAAPRRCRGCDKQPRRKLLVASNWAGVQYNQWIKMVPFNPSMGEIMMHHQIGGYTMLHHFRTNPFRDLCLDVWWFSWILLSWR